MVARSEFAVPLDRSEVRSSSSGSLDNVDSQLLVISGKNKVRPTSRGNSDTKHTRTSIRTAPFLIGSALSTSGQLGREQQ